MNKLEDALKAWQDRYDKAPRQKAVTFPGTAQKSAYALCPPPIRMGQDQHRCQKCGLVWDVDEDKPACQDAEQTNGGTK